MIGGLSGLGAKGGAILAALNQPYGKEEEHDMQSNMIENKILGHFYSELSK